MKKIILLIVIISLYSCKKAHYDKSCDCYVADDVKKPPVAEADSTYDAVSVGDVTIPKASEYTGTQEYVYDGSKFDTLEVGNRLIITNIDDNGVVYIKLDN